MTLTPSVTLDGVSAADRVIYQWRQLDNPGAVSFSDPAIAGPVATFLLDGSYRLALDTTFSGQVTSDELAVTVNTRAGGSSGSVNRQPTTSSASHRTM